MRDLIVTENITIDGVIDAAGGWFAPGAGEDNDQSDVVDVLREQSAASDALLLGRVTFEDMRGYWPLQADDRTGIADYLDNVNKYVVSKTLEEPNWANTTVLRGPVVEDVRTLKASPGADIVTTGSMTLTRDLIATGLIDEYRLFVYPVVIGRGHRLFDNATEVRRLKLEDFRPFRSGIVLLRYRTTPRSL
jgi:dihydrofolate reductase